MKITKSGFIYQITFFPSWFPVNCYLADEGQALTLIDAALPFSYKEILRTARQLGKPITRIILTHAHSDHIGALDQLKSRLPHCEVVISQRDAKLLNGDRSLETGEAQTPIRGGVPKPGAIQTIPDILVSDGDTIGSFRVVSAPGHTPGHIALFNEQNRILIAGDAFQTRGGAAVSGQLRPLFPFPALATWNKETAVRSARVLRDLSPDLLCVGHGKMIHHPKEVMTLAIKKAEDALKG